MKSIQDRINYLKKCANLYETNGTSPLTDAEYDIEYETLKKLDPENQFFKEVGGLDEEFVSFYGDTIPHEILMGSLNKSANIDDFEKWLRNTYKDQENDFISHKLEFVLQYKIDGLSLSCLYKKGKLVQCLTRGDGQKGINTLSNALYVDDIPKNIDCEDDVEVRGEIYKDRESFKRVWLGIYSNERNFAAGSLNQKVAKITGERGLSFIAYECVRKHFFTETNKTHFLQDKGFKTMITSMKSGIGGNFNNIVSCVKDFMDSIDRDKLPFSIDGIVVKLDQIDVAKEMGSTDEGKRPKSNRAVKFPCEQKEATLKGVEWGIGRTGNLTCVGILDPVDLAGTKVSRVTLHNPRFIEEMQINIGCKLLIQKSGDIIPYVVQKRSDGNEKISIPNKCPSCNGGLEWNEKRVTKKCINENCPSQFSQRIDKFFKTIGVKGIGEGILDRLLQLKDADGKDLVSGISDCYTLDKHIGILSKEFGPQATKNIISAINEVKELTLDQFMEALGIDKIGSMAKEIVSIAPSIDEIDKLTVEKLLNIQGFAEIKAKCFLDGWKKVRKDVDKILKHVSIKEKEMKSMKLEGRTFCITGTLSQPRNDFQKMIEDNGGKFSSSVSGKLSFLICGEDSGSKRGKAEKLGVKIISEKEFMDMLK